jgi:hypothetical protein
MLYTNARPTPLTEAEYDRLPWKLQYRGVRFSRDSFEQSRAVADAEADARDWLAANDARKAA